MTPAAVQVLPNVRMKLKPRLYRATRVSTCLLPRLAPTPPSCRVSPRSHPVLFPFFTCRFFTFCFSREQRSFQGRKEVTFVQPRSQNRDNGILGLLDSLPLPDGSLQRVRFRRSCGISFDSKYRTWLVAFTGGCCAMCS